MIWLCELSDEFLKFWLVLNENDTSEAPIKQPGDHSLKRSPDIFLFISDAFPVHEKDSSQQSAAAIGDLGVV